MRVTITPFFIPQPAPECVSVRQAFLTTIKLLSDQQKETDKPLYLPTSLVMKLSGLSDVVSPCLTNISLRVSYPLTTTNVRDPMIKLNTSPYFFLYSWNLSNMVSGLTLRRFPRKGTVGGPGGRVASLVVFFHQMYRTTTTHARETVQISTIFATKIASLQTELVFLYNKNRSTFSTLHLEWLSDEMPQAPFVMNFSCNKIYIPYI